MTRLSSPRTAFANRYPAYNIQPEFFMSRTKNDYEDRLRNLEDIMNFLLARQQSPVPSTGSFRYLIQRGLEPVLSAEATSSLTVNWQAKQSGRKIRVSSSPWRQNLTVETHSASQHPIRSSLPVLPPSRSATTPALSASPIGISSTNSVPALEIVATATGSVLCPEACALSPTTPAGFLIDAVSGCKIAVPAQDPTLASEVDNCASSVLAPDPTSSSVPSSNCTSTRSSSPNSAESFSPALLPSRSTAPSEPLKTLESLSHHQTQPVDTLSGSPQSMNSSSPALPPSTASTTPTSCPHLTISSIQTLNTQNQEVDLLILKPEELPISSNPSTLASTSIIDLVADPRSSPLSLSRPTPQGTLPPPTATSTGPSPSPSNLPTNSNTTTPMITPQSINTPLAQSVPWLPADLPTTTTGALLVLDEEELTTLKEQGDPRYRPLEDSELVPRELEDLEHDLPPAAPDKLGYLASISAVNVVNEEFTVTLTNGTTIGRYTGIDPASLAAIWDIPEDDPDEEVASSSETPAIYNLAATGSVSVINPTEATVSQQLATQYEKILHEAELADYLEYLRENGCLQNHSN
ncbi:hypothetical protein MJO28_017201 [Puccinia striiformis f. sp. tritici]|uniref:Uncharacterized protein n=2 Tax=Puccinia striiformis TaxID=27350 RepID=A0A2S4VC37_9BASI|nr:hypothetical protein MJO28_017201 [Puccinia striiformis f. sp. tritici]POW07103.1 hypothetical protein PSTT_08519 [Puccinia striiformis]